MNQPLVSIVVPVYNAARYVAETIESLLRQDYPSLEILVVDDGSTDDSNTVIAKYQPKVRLLTQTNGGQSRALNHGWQEAKGEILGYLGADDLLDASAVTKLVKAILSQGSCVGIYPDYRLIDENGKILRSVAVPDFALAEVVATQVCPPGPGLLFLKSAYEKAGPWRTDLRQIPDFDFLLRLGLVGPVVHFKEELASFRVHEGSQSFAISSPDKAEEPVRVMADYFQRPGLPRPIAELKSKSLSYAHMISARLHARSGRWGAAIGHIVSALTLRPLLALSWRPYRLMASALFGRLYYRLFKGVGS